MAQTRVGLVQWFSDWHRGRVDLGQLRAVAARGAIPQITWEPWDSARGGSKQPAFRLASIVDGRHDAYIRSWARDLRGYGKPVQLRFAQEMNGLVYPWAEGKNHNRPGDYARMWRHVHDIFTAEGATNVLWVWSPLARTIVEGQYPGDRYVDIVGLSGFNGGSALPWGGWRTFEDIFDAPLQSLRRLAPDKPGQISEVATADQGGNKPLWIKAMFDYLQGQSWVRSVLWFDLPKQTDWRVATSPAAERVFVDGVARMQGAAPPASAFALPPTSPTSPTLPTPPNWRLGSAVEVDRELFDEWMAGCDGLQHSRPRRAAPRPRLRERVLREQVRAARRHGGRRHQPVRADGALRRTGRRSRARGHRLRVRREVPPAQALPNLPQLHPSAVHEEQDDGDDRQGEQHRMDDGATRDGDDQ